MRETDGLLQQARDEGWEVERTGSGHYRLRNPAGEVVIIGSTPHSGNRSLANERALLRRHGLGTGVDHKTDARRLRAQREVGVASQQERILNMLMECPSGVTRYEVVERLQITPDSVSKALWRLQQTHPVRRLKLGGSPALWVLEVESPPREPEAESVPEEVDPPSDTIELAVPGGVIPQPRGPLRVVPSMPDDSPSLFEAVTTDSHGNIVLRDENGGLWLAVPLAPDVEAYR